MVHPITKTKLTLIQMLTLILTLTLVTLLPLDSGGSRWSSLGQDEPPRTSHHCVKLSPITLRWQIFFCFLSRYVIVVVLTENHQFLGTLSTPDFFLGFCLWTPLRDIHSPRPCEESLFLNPGSAPEFVISSSPIGVRSTAMSASVCLSVCLSVRL